MIPVIKVLKMSFGRCYLLNNELVAIRYEHLIDTPSHPSFNEVFSIWFDPTKDENHYEYHRVGLENTAPPGRFKGYGPSKYDLVDKDFIHRKFPEVFL